MRIVAFLAAVAMALSPLVARAYAVTDVMSAPFVDNVTASLDGTVLVWKVHARGQRNLFANAGGTIHQVTHYDVDDGQDLADVQILPANDAVVYMRGGVEDNADDGNLNPLSIIPPPERTIFIVPLAGGDPHISESGTAWRSRRAVTLQRSRPRVCSMSCR